MTLLLLTVLHLLCSAAVLLLARHKLLRVGPEMGFLCLFMPVIGFFLVLMIHIMARNKEREERTIDVSRMKLNDEIYRTIHVEDRNDKSIVPLEDALTLDDPLQRRELLLEILKDDSSRYLDALHSAQQNEDSEVVHYATTALSENLRKYEYNLRQLELAVNNTPDDAASLRDFAQELQNYLKSGMIDGQVAIARAEQYIGVLQRLLKLEWNASDALLLFGVLLERGRTEMATALLEQMQQSWPDDKAVFFARMKLAWKQQNRAELERAITEASSGAFHLTDEEMSELAFWGKASSADAVPVKEGQMV